MSGDGKRGDATAPVLDSTLGLVIPLSDGVKLLAASIRLREMYICYYVHSNMSILTCNFSDL